MLKNVQFNTISLIAGGILFVLLNAFFVYNFGVLYVSFIPIILIIAYLAFTAYDNLFYLTVFLTPLSVNLSKFMSDISFNISILSEPLLIVLLFILSAKFFLSRQVEAQFIKHPITLSILFFFFWTFITSVSSSMPIVSFKFLLSKFWLIIPVFFFGFELFKKKKNIKIFLWAYGISLFIVVMYSTVRLSQISFLSNNAAHFVVKPFYNDHTAYGAVAAMFAPLFIGLTFRSQLKPTIRIITGFFAFMFTLAVILSYSRASWLGILAALGIFVLIKLKIKFKYIVFVSVIIVAFLASFWFQIIDRLEKNDQDSSSNLTHHISSITNIRTDASNVERLNRWYCALEMFKEKPLTGYGPGTYQFQYAPFQLERMRTIISTNFGDVGNAHSEYLGPLAEQGIFGLLAFLILVITILQTGFKVYKKSNDREIKMLAISISLGFITYFLHGFLNNFLDTDKLAVPFFGFAAILVALDLYHSKGSETNESLN